MSNNVGRVEDSKLLLKNLYNIYLKPFKRTVTLTFGDLAESHVGMQKIGKMAERGFRLSDVQKATKWFEK